MTEENNENQDGYAAPQPTPPENIEPPAEVGYSQPQVDPYAQQAGQYGTQPAPAPKKKSKMWLWITLAITIPLLLCIIGAAIVAVFVTGEVKSQIDPVNQFYSAVRDDESINDFLCEDEIEYGSVELDLEDYEDMYGQVEEFNFDGFETVNGDTVVRGTVTREDGTLDAEVEVVKEDGKYRVCSIDER